MPALAALVRAATLAAALGAAPAETPAPDPSRQWTEPPPGSAQDQALWRAGTEVSDQITLCRLEANKLQWQARQGRYDGRLEELTRKADAPNPPTQRAGALLQRYREVVAKNYVFLTAQWPVDPTRGCRYQVMHLGGVMLSEEHPRKGSQLRVVREDLEQCVERARPAVKEMSASNAELQRVLAEADRLLQPLAP